jgi:hypothetical protein
VKEEKKYLCIRDNQQGEFGMYRLYTIEEWREQAIDWCEADGEKQSTIKYLQKLKKSDVIWVISDLWDIEIVEFDKSNEEHLGLLEREV